MRYLLALNIMLFIRKSPRNTHAMFCSTDQFSYKVNYRLQEAVWRLTIHYRTS